jgi:hypothetical protein
MVPIEVLDRVTTMAQTMSATAQTFSTTIENINREWARINEARLERMEASIRGVAATQQQLLGASDGSPLSVRSGRGAEGDTMDSAPERGAAAARLLPLDGEAHVGAATPTAGRAARLPASPRPAAASRAPM